MASGTMDDAGRWQGFEAIPLRITVRVGTARLKLGRLAAIAPGDLILLDRTVGAPFDLLAQGRLVGRVEPVGSDTRVAVKLAGTAGDEEDADGAAR